MTKLLLLFFCFISSSVSWATDELFWEQGYQKIKAHEYQSALSQFLSVKEQNAALYMVIAQCYQELGHSALSKGYNNKAFVAGTVSQKKRIFDENRGYSVLNAVQAVILSIPIVVWQFLFLFFFLLFLFYTMHLLLRVGILLILILTGIGIKQGYEVQKPRAMVITSAAKVFLIPQEESPELFVLKEGNEILLRDKKDTFFKIEAPDGIGWVSNQDIFAIVPL